MQRPKLCASGRKRSITSPSNREVVDLAHLVDHREVVAVPDHAAPSAARSCRTCRCTCRGRRRRSRAAARLDGVGIAVRVLAAARAQVVEVGEREHVLEAEACRPWRAARRPRRGCRPPPSARRRTRRRAPSCSCRSARSLRRRAPARSRTGPTRRRVEARIAKASPLRTPSASSPWASSSTARPASAHETLCHSSSSSDR